MSVNEDINLADNPVIAHIRCVYFFLYVLINLTYNSKYKKKITEQQMLMLVQMLLLDTQLLVETLNFNFL